MMGRAFLLQLFGRTWAIVSLLDKMCLECIAVGTMLSLTHPIHPSPASSEKPHRHPRADPCQGMLLSVACSLTGAASLPCCSSETFVCTWSLAGQGCRESAQSWCAMPCIWAQSPPLLQIMNELLNLWRLIDHR